MRMLSTLAALLVVAVAPAHAVSVVEVTSPKGVHAYFAEDHTSPVISVQFSFEGGTALDPIDKQGLSELGTSLFNEGAGDLDSFAFQSAMEDRAISIGMSADRDRIHGTITTTTPTVDEAVRLGRLALLQPRYDQEAVERMRREILVAIAARAEVPGRLASTKLYGELFGGHPYAREEEGEADTVKKLTRADVQAWAKSRLTRDRLLVGVSGDLTAAQLAPMLDALFADLPATGTTETLPAAKVSTVGTTSRIMRDLTQTTILIGSPGIARRDPDWYAATVADYIFGSGAFASRLMNEVREKRGLAYTVRSALQPMDKAAVMVVSAGTRADQADQSLSVIKDEFAKMRDPGATQAEVDGAKQFLVGAWPLRFTTTASVANLLVEVQHDHLGIDYLDKRNALIEAVTLADVQRVSKRLYKPEELSIVIVGPDKAASAAPAGAKAPPTPKPAPARSDRQ